MNKNLNDMKQTMHNRFFATMLMAVAICTGTLSAQTFQHQAGILRNATTTKNGHEMQDVHEYRQVVYAKAGQQITLQRPEYQTYIKYTRWFDYETDAAAGAALQVPGGANYNTPDGAFYFNNNNRLNATYTMPNDGRVHYIACDQSVYTDYTSSPTLLKEPTLSQRLVFEIRPASQMATLVDAATGDNWLEVHDMIAPTGNQLYIGPDYEFTTGGKYPNYFYNAANPVSMNAAMGGGKTTTGPTTNETTRVITDRTTKGTTTTKINTETQTKYYQSSILGWTQIDALPAANKLENWRTYKIETIEIKTFSRTDGYTKETEHVVTTTSIESNKPGWYWTNNNGTTSTPTPTNGWFINVSSTTAGSQTYSLRYNSAQNTVTTTSTSTFTNTQKGTKEIRWTVSSTTTKEGTVTGNGNNKRIVWGSATTNSPQTSAESVYSTNETQNTNTKPVVTGPTTTTTGTAGQTYNIAKFNVKYISINEIGPKVNLAENNRLDGAVKVTEQRFNFEGGRTAVQDNATYYCTPLSSAESSYGFTAPGSANKRPDGAQLKPYWGEYAFMHTTDGVNWGGKTSLTNHTLPGDANNNGYLLYVDGSNTPGELVNLRFNADLCPGSKMYFSAFVANIGGSTPPNLDFILTGVDNVGKAHVLTTYTTGEFGNDVGQWQRILFPFEFGDDIDYKYYTLKITNKGKNASGNDFVIDDIQIYTQKPPVVPVQASTHGCAAEDGTMVTAAYLRIDYHAIQDAASEYVYQWRDHNNQPVAGLTYYYNQTNPAGNYGKVTILSDSQITPAMTCASLLDFDSQYSQTTVPVVRYIKETVQGQQRYVLYIAQPITLRANYLYTGYLATSYAELGSREGCGTYADLLVAGGTTINLNGEAISNGEPEVVCGGNHNELEIIYKFMAQNTQTGELTQHVLDCKADWLYGDAAYIDAHADIYGGDFDHISDAIEAVQAGTATAEQQYIVSNLSKIGLLTLNSKGINIELMGSQKSVSYIAFPIAGSAGTYTICTSPSTITLTLPDKLNAVVIGNSTDASCLPEYVLLNPRRVRVGENSKNAGEISFGIYLHSDDENLKYTCNKATLASTTYNGSAALPASITITPMSNGVATAYINRQTDAIKVSGIESLPAGYDYTFKLVKALAAGSVDDCTESDTYFRLRIVPNEVTWQPTTDNQAWNNDANWSSFAPLAETNVILRAADYTLPEDEPVSGDIQSSSYSRFEEGAQQYITYDINYQPSTCKNIYLPAGAALVGQERIQITGQAFVDIEAVPGKWVMTAFPIKGVISGDIYIPQTESNQPFSVKAINQTLGQDATDRTLYPFYHSLYNANVKAADGKGEVKSTEWTLASNSNTVPYAPGYAVSLGLDCEATGKIIRLPKPESISSYRYYQYGAWVSTYEAAISRAADYGKPAYEYNEGLGGMQFTLTGNTASDIYLFGNPTFAYLDMDRVVEGNSNLEGTYYVSANSNSRSAYTTHVAGKSSAQGVKNIIAPCSAVLLKTTTSGTATQLLVTPQMMCTSKGEHEPSRRQMNAPRRAMAAEEEARAIYITATAKDFTSYAAIFSEEGASNSAVSGEDAQVMLLDKNKTPFALYTVADSLGLSINQIEAGDTSMQIIPLGFYAQKKIAEETLRFAGDDAFLQEWDLIDATNNITWALSDGFEVLVSMPQDGSAQFFLQHTRAQAPAGGNTATGISDVADMQGQYAVYDATGRMISGKANINALRGSLPQGVYILRNGEETIKVVLSK